MKLTENAVLVTPEGKLAHVKVSPNPLDPTNNKLKVRTMVLVSDGSPVTAAAPITVDSVERMVQFIEGFNALKVEKRSGYDSYVNNYGPTNPTSPRDLTTQGLVKIMAVYATVLHERIAKGGAEGDEAKNGIAILTAYNAVAQAEILKRDRDSLLAKVATTFTPDEIAAERARQNGTLKAASIAVEEAAEETVEAA